MAVCLLGAKIVTDKGYGDIRRYDYSANASGVLVELFAGARYYFTDNFGVMGELGYGIAWLKLGVSLKVLICNCVQGLFRAVHASDPE